AEVQEVTATQQTVTLQFTNLPGYGQTATAMLDRNAGAATNLQALKTATGLSDLSLAQVTTANGATVYTITFGGTVAGRDFVEIKVLGGGATVRTLKDGEFADGFFVLNTQGPYNQY